MTRVLPIASVLSAALTLYASVATAQGDAATDRRKAHIVSRHYQLIYGLPEMCNRFSPNEAPKVSSAVSRFKKTYPELMKLIDQSPFLEIAKKRNREMIDSMTELAAKDSKYAGCQETIEMLRQLNEHPDGKHAVAETIRELTK